MSKYAETITEAIETLFDLDALQRNGIGQIVASAIREAQASARDDALEEAGNQARRAASYTVPEPRGGFRPVASFGADEKTKLRPIAETLAMLDGNAFFGTDCGDGNDWQDQYLPEASALYEANGGDAGWAGQASFACSLKSKG